ncbi:metalloregulator ArsR/SmtB family transcription factor [bacterium]|nr:metalloregulator ArsR/SmtB family transcription factor [bacterium]
MGFVKSQKYTAKQNELAAVAKALAHPARIAILEILFNRACICGEIVEELPLSQASVSQHLKELKNAGLIKGEIEGPKVCYCIDKSGWQTARKWLDMLLVQEESCC